MAREGRMPWRLGLAAALSAIFAACTQASGCDLDALRHYPMANALMSRAQPLRRPDLFFKEAGAARDVDRYALDEAGAAQMRAALARGLATFGAVERPVVMLAAIDHWTNGGASLKSLLVSSESVFLDEALRVLDAEGFAAQAGLLREGRALFGPRFGTQAERYARWSDGRGEVRDEALDAAMDRLSERFRALPRLVDEATARIARSPDLGAIYEPLRAGADDDDRLEFLTQGLWQCLDHYDAPPAVAARLAALPAPHARIVVVRIFEAEMLNGSMHQAFFNSSGVLAPDVVAALRAMGLEKQAAAVERGIAMFPTPYPRDTAERRAFMGRQNEAFDTALGDLTGDADDGAMHQAMIATAREAGILPR